MNYNTDETSIQIKIKYAKEAAKVLCPLIVSLGATAGTILLLGSHSLKTEAALIGSLIAAKHQLEEIRTSYLNNVPLDDVVNHFRLRDVKDIPDAEDRILLYEPYSDQVIPTTEEKILIAEDNANRKLQRYYIVRLSSIIKDLGGKPCDILDYLGWETANERQMEQWNLAKCPYIKLSRYPAHYSISENPIDCLDYDIPPAMLSS